MNIDERISELERSVKSDPNISNITELANLYSRLGKKENPVDLLNRISSIKGEIFSYFENKKANKSDPNGYTTDEKLNQFHYPIEDYTNQYWFMHNEFDYPDRNYRSLYISKYEGPGIYLCYWGIDFTLVNLLEFRIQNPWHLAEQEPNLGLEEFTLRIKEIIVRRNGTNVTNFIWKKEDYTLFSFVLDLDEMFSRYFIFDNSKKVDFRKLWKECKSGNKNEISRI